MSVRPIETLAQPGDGAREVAVAPVAWLAALPHAAAVIIYEDGRVSVAQSNAAFDALFATTDFDARSPPPPSWTARALALFRSGNTREQFDLEVDRHGLHSCYRCTMTRVDSGAGGPEQMLFVAADRTTEIQAERTLRRELLSDSLTALPNRAGFSEAAEQGIVDRQGGAYAIVAVDLMRFSRVNESLGPLAGDELIITVARRLKSVLRSQDILARIGGNEFAIFSHIHNGVSDVLQIGERIHAALGTPVRLSTYQITVECAIGCAIAPTGEEEPEQALRRAQAAVKRAKESGKLEIYRNGALREAEHRFSIESRLREALAEGGLQLAFQPIVHLADGLIKGFEVLSRWYDPTIGAVSPGEFIPVAEESGLIMPLGRWALYESAQALARWDRQFGTELPIGLNVNVSAVQIARDDVPHIVEEALRHAGIGGHRLTVELTESAVISDPDKARALLGALKAMSVTIAMDDFGTGFSNLASLQSLPIDILKIDRSFVAGMTRDRDKQAIVRAIISLAHTLDMRTTAEGIETEAEAAMLASFGCHFGQGYWFSRPQTEQDAYERWLDNPLFDAI
jgi:diguanylate cyclase (GGDEF)-like protein